MYRKLLIATAVLAASTSVALAANYKGDYKGEAAPCPTYQYMAGPYIGLSVGPIINGTGTPTYYKGIAGTLSAGYGMMLNPSWYLAGEIFGGNSANIKDYKDQATGLNGARSSWFWGISVIPGVMITDHVLAYARAGGTWAQFNNTAANNQTVGAWHVGVGGQTNVYQNWDVRMEYVYNGFGSVHNIGKVMSDQVNFGVVYKFI